MRKRTCAALLALAAGLVAGPATSPANAAGCDGTNVVGNPGFESGTTPWTATSGVISASGSTEASHSGSYLAWLDGYGSTHTDTLSQSVTIPAGCTSASLTYWLHIDTKETGSTVYDRLTVQLGSTTVASYSNVNAAAGYQQRTIDATSFIGQTVTLKFTGTEDSSLQTSFAVDDVALSATGGSTSQNPAVTNPGAQTSTVGTAASLQIQASDPQGDTLTYSATGLPAGLSINASSGLISGTPTTAGTSSVTVTAKDPGNNSGTATFGWTVNSATQDATRTPSEPAYTVNLTSDSQGFTWTGTESVTFKNASSTALSEVYLRLWDNYHGTCPSNTPITVTNVTGGTAGSLTVGCTALKVTLTTPLSQGQTGTVGFDLKVVVPNGVDRFGHDGSYSFIGNALPVLAVRDAAGWHLDPYTNNGESFYTLISDFDVTLTHPTSLKTPATGTSTETTSGTNTITRAVASKVRDFAWASGPFSSSSTTTPAGTKVNTYWGSGISSSTAASMQSTSAAAIDAHATRAGAYPYGEVDVLLDNNFWFGGMEYPGLVMDTASSTAAVHELGHQWYYGIVGNDEYNNPWLDESFTDYLTDLYFNKTGSGCGITWASADEKLSNSMAYWDQHSSRYSTVVYGYGKCTLHDLRRTIGDTAMANLIKSYSQSHWYGVSTTADFKAAAQVAAGTTDLTQFWADHRVIG